MRRLFADYQELAVLSALRTSDPELLNRTVDQVPWSSTRARTAMRSLSKQRGLKDRLLTLGELITYTPGELLAMKNVGTSTLSAIQQTLAGLGLRLRDI
jgi:DNA-directed RNA polymerase alpha subunit